MVQIVPNWATVHGRVEAVEPADDGGTRVRLHVDAAEDVPGFANLLQRVVGGSIEVDVPPGAAAAAPGEPFHGRLRQTGVERYRVDADSITTS